MSKKKIIDKVHALLRQMAATWLPTAIQQLLYNSSINIIIHRYHLSIIRLIKSFHDYSAENSEQQYD